MTKHYPEEQRRREIIEVALELFTTVGFEKTSMEQIARRAGLSKGAVYWYFDGKLELMFAAAQCYFDKDIEALNRLTREGDYGPKGIYLIHRELFEERLCDPVRGRLFGELTALMGRYPQVRELYISFHRRWDEAAAALIAGAMDAGEFRRGDALAISRAIGALYHGLCERKAFDRDIDVVSIIETATRLFYNALTANKDSQDNLPL